MKLDKKTFLDYVGFAMVDHVATFAAAAASAFNATCIRNSHRLSYIATAMATATTH